MIGGRGAPPRRARFGAALISLTFVTASWLLASAWIRPGSAEDAHAPLSPLPERPLLDPAKVKLGEALFGDPILSSRQALSCSSCHDLARGGTIHRAKSIGYDGRMHEFNVPTIFNVGHNYRLGWRGGFTSLAAKTEQVLTNPDLMANDWSRLLPRLRSAPGYNARFVAVYGRPPDREAVLDALVTYQRSLVTPDAPFDRFLKGDDGAITAQQRHGYKLFRAYGCISCHQGSNIGGNMSQIFGVFGVDRGLGQQSPRTPHASLADITDERNVYRVPSLRNVAITPPYFHDGRTFSLAEAVDAMATGQLGRTLTRLEIAAITAFLESLTGEYDGKPLVASPIEGRR